MRPTRGLRLRTASGFTLIEMLAVIVITSLVIGMGAINISATADQTALKRSEAMLRQLDARARLQARIAGDPVLMSIDREARSIVLTSRLTGEVLSRFDIPPNVEITFELPSMAHPRLVFDSRGRSADYAVVIRIEATGTRLVFHGLTGDVSITEVAS